MNLAARVERIERAVRPAGGCAVCLGKGPRAPHFTLFEGQPLPPLPRCGGCGRVFRGPFRVVWLPREAEQG